MKNKNSDYWKNRFEQLEQASYKKGASFYAELEEQYYKAQKEISDKIAQWYGRFADNNKISMAEARKMLNAQELKELKWDVNEYIKHGRENAHNQKWVQELENASAQYHISRYEALQLQLQNSIESLFGNQSDEFDRVMRDIYQNGYYHTAFEIQKGIGAGSPIAAIDERKLDKIIRKPWAADGKNFSDRIWDNKQKLINELHTQMTQACIVGKGADEAIHAIAQRMNVSKSSAARLVQTESAYFSSSAQKDCFNDLDVEKYQIIATIDDMTSDICADMDGQIFDMKDYEEGVTAPPFHCNCRSYTAPYFADEEGMRATRDEDGNYYTVPSDMTYREWEKQAVDSQGKFAASNAIKNTHTELKYDDKADFSIIIPGYSSEVNVGLSKASAKVAELGGKDRLEHMVLVDLETGKEIYYEKGTRSSVGFAEYYKFISNNLDKKLAFVHNHNTDGCFSESDMRTLLRSDNISAFIATRIDGVKYIAQKTRNAPENISFDKLYEKELENLNKLSRSGIISSAKRTRQREEIIVNSLLKDYTKGLVELDGRRTK